LSSKGDNDVLSQSNIPGHCCNVLNNTGYAFPQDNSFPDVTYIYSIEDLTAIHCVIEGVYSYYFAIQQSICSGISTASKGWYLANIGN
jgi:hypothetical protein